MPSVEGKDCFYAPLTPEDAAAERSHIHFSAVLMERRGSIGAAQQVYPGGKVRWITPKSCKRAIEKAVRSYHNDVSLLTDMARQCLVYETPAQLADALRAIYQDPEVRVVRVKNRLSTLYDATPTAGYRDVLVNITLHNANQVPHRVLKAFLTEFTMTSVRMHRLVVG